MHLFLFVCLFVRAWILHPEWIIPFFRDLVSSPRCLALVTHLLPGDDLHQLGQGEGTNTSVLIPYGEFKSLHHIRPAQGSNSVPKQMPGTSAGFRLSSASKGIRIRTYFHRPIQTLARFSPNILRPFLAYSLIPSGEASSKLFFPVAWITAPVTDARQSLTL